jgi:hypothetical protein
MAFGRGAMTFDQGPATILQVAVITTLAIPWRTGWSLSQLTVSTKAPSGQSPIRTDASDYIPTRPQSFSRSFAWAHRSISLKRNPKMRRSAKPRRALRTIRIQTRQRPTWFPTLCSPRLRAHCCWIDNNHCTAEDSAILSHVCRVHLYACSHQTEKDQSPDT